MKERARPSRLVRLALGIAVIALPALGSSAGAAPFVGQYRGLSTSLTVVGADGARYEIDLVATQSVVSATAPEQALYLDIRRCTRTRCTVVQKSRTPLGPTQVDVSPDMTSVRLDVQLGGLRLRGDGTGAYVTPGSSDVQHPGVGLYPLETTSGGPTLRFDVTSTTHGTVRLGSVVCAGKTLDVFTFQAVDRIGDDVRDPHSAGDQLPRGLLTGRLRPSCR